MKSAFILVIVTLVALESTDAWRSRLKLSCLPYWTIACNDPTDCAPANHSICWIGRILKRIIRVRNGEKRFSRDFYMYDLNNDERITLSEFATAISSTPQKCVKLFELADKNGDGVLSKNEFFPTQGRAPFLFDYST
ncbi:unnamed protein product [Owenia fusiformis]|uniref:EF-hand domain-containing protein n=2 Tax=Owenia fusiformis TaxID=6347 RepID=A0A8S4Q3I3_OWEFU|nr:unnamed protein product [Owenia fusiformis]